MANSAFGGFSAKGNVTQRKGNNYKSKSNLRHDVNVPKSHNILLLNQYAKINDTIPNKISTVNTNALEEGSTPGNIGPISAKPNQKTEKSIKKSAATESKTESDLSTINQYNTQMGDFSMG